MGERSGYARTTRSMFSSLSLVIKGNSPLEVTCIRKCPSPCVQSWIIWSTFLWKFCFGPFYRWPWEVEKNSVVSVNLMKVTILAPVPCSDELCRKLHLRVCTLIKGEEAKEEEEASQHRLGRGRRMTSPFITWDGKPPTICPNCPHKRTAILSLTERHSGMFN